MHTTHVVQTSIGPSSIPLLLLRSKSPSSKAIAGLKHVRERAHLAAELKHVPERQRNSPYNQATFRCTKCSQIPT